MKETDGRRLAGDIWELKESGDLEAEVVIFPEGDYIILSDTQVNGELGRSYSFFFSGEGILTSKMIDTYLLVIHNIRSELDRIYFKVKDLNSTDQIYLKVGSLV